MVVPPNERVTNLGLDNHSHLMLHYLLRLNQVRQRSAVVIAPVNNDVIATMLRAFAST